MIKEFTIGDQEIVDLIKLCEWINSRPTKYIARPMTKRNGNAVMSNSSEFPYASAYWITDDRYSEVCLKFKVIGWRACYGWYCIRDWRISVELIRSFYA